MPPEFDVNEAAQRIEQYEGRSAKVYNDSRGIPTVGIGFNLTRTDASAKLAALGLDINKVKAGTQTLKDAQIDSLFQGDLQAAVNSAKDSVDNFDDLTPARQFVVTDMVFNMGQSKFEGFKETIKAINADDWDTAAQEMEDSDWYHQVGDRSVQDVEMMQTGDFTGDPSA